MTRQVIRRPTGLRDSLRVKHFYFSNPRLRQAGETGLKNYSVQGNGQFAPHTPESGHHGFRPASS